MSEQVKDLLFYKNIPYIFIAAENIYSLFDPAKYGLCPTEYSTACYKGFRCDFIVIDDYLYMDGLEIYCENKKYPKIGNVKPKKHRSASGLMLYKDLKLFLTYNGKIIVGDNVMDNFRGRTFISEPHYENVFELNIEKGKVINFRKKDEDEFRNDTFF